MLIPLLANQAELGEETFVAHSRADLTPVRLTVRTALDAAVARQEPVAVRLVALARAVAAVAVTDVLATGLSDPALRTIELTEGDALAAGLGELTAAEVRLVRAEAVRIGLGDVLQGTEFTPSQMDQVGIHWGEDAVAGILEPWSVPDTTANVNGRQPWTRMRGTMQGVQGGRYRVLSNTLGGGVGYTYSRCDTPIGTPNYRVRLTVPRLIRNDSPDVSIGPIARKDNSATHTFYQLRARVAAVQSGFSLWRAVNDSFTQLASTVPGVIQPNDVLDLEVIGDGLTTTALVAYWNGVPIIGPIDDSASGIHAGDFAGVMGYWESGVSAHIEGDDFAIFPLPAATVVRSGTDILVAQLTERVAALLNTFTRTESLPIRLRDLPEETFFPLVSSEALAMVLGEPDPRARVGLPQAESIAVDLGEAPAAHVALHEAEVIAGDVSEATAVAIENPTEKAGTDPLAMGLAEGSAQSGVAFQEVRATVPIGLTDAGVKFIAVSGPLGPLHFDAAGQITVAGLDATGTVTVAGPGVAGTVIRGGG